MFDNTSRENDQESSDESIPSLLRELAVARQRIRALESRVRSGAADSEESPAGSDDRLRRLLGNLQELILVLDADRLITDVAGNCMGLLGYAASELCGPGVQVDVLQLFDGDDRGIVLEQFAQARLHPQGSVREVRIMDRAGESRWVECTLVPLYGETEQQLTGAQLILRDVSDRVRAEQMMHALNRAAAAVQKASLSLDDVIKAVTGQLCDLGLNSGVGLYTSDRSEIEWVGFCGEARFLQTIELLQGQSAPASLQSMEVLWERLGAGYPAIIHMNTPTLRGITQDPVLARQIAQLLGPMTGIVVPLRAEAHDLGYLVVAASWLDEDSLPAIQAYANQTAIAIRNSRLIGLLAESETQYRAIFEAARDGLFVMDSAGRVVAASLTTCQLLATGESTIVGRNVEALFSVSLEEIISCCQDGMQDDDNATVLAQAFPDTGDAFPVELRGSCVLFDGETHLMVLITDISERIRAQEALIQSERLSALGQMAGGIAHDFNNMLVSILGFAQMAAADARAGGEGLLEDLAQLEAGARDAAEAVSRLQALYRESDDVSDLVPVQLDDVVMDTLALHRPRWKDIPQFQGITYEIVTRLSGPSQLLGNPGELRRVLSNLLINALDAMPEGGTVFFDSWQQGSETCISIRDTGHGIAPEILPRVTEPFFTTKRSSGLGLTVTDTIVKRHGGKMLLDSTPGKGTCVTLSFPCYDSSVGAGRRIAEATPATVSGPLNALVVDDEPRVRAVLERVLQRQGHQVTTAAGGVEGLAALGERRYDLMICDLGMPGLSGSVVMQRAHAMHPRMPIIVTTGWGETVTPGEMREMCAVALLAKPFGQEDVRRVVAEALDWAATH